MTFLRFTDLDCIVKDSSSEIIEYLKSEKTKKQILIYDSSSLPGETVSHILKSFSSKTMFLKNL